MNHVLRTLYCGFLSIDCRESISERIMSVLRVFTGPLIMRRMATRLSLSWVTISTNLLFVLSTVAFIVG